MVFTQQRQTEYEHHALDTCIEDKCPRVSPPKLINQGQDDPTISGKPQGSKIGSRSDIKVLIKLLPTRIESVFILEYLCKRMEPTTKNTQERFVEQKLNQLNQLKDNEIIKQSKEIAKTPEDLTEHLIQTALLNDATRRFIKVIDYKIEYYMELFMAEQRGNWLHKLTEIMDDRNSKKKLLRQGLNFIRLGNNIKTFCKVLINS